MNRRVLILMLFVVVLAIGGWVGGPKLLRRLSFFRIHQVDVVGNRYLDEREVVRMLGLAPDASVFDPLDKVRARAAQLPGTIGSSAVVERRFPGTLRVRIVETVPVALAPVDGRLALLDYRGRVLPFDPIRVPTSMPIADADSMIAALLARLRLADDGTYTEVQTARSDHGDILLDLGEHTIRVRPNADNETLRAIAPLRRYLDTSNRKWTEIDARYHGRLFARMAKA